MAERKSRSTIDTLLVAPTASDKKIRAAILEWVRSAVAQLGGWRSLSAFQRASLISCKISLTILMVSEQTLVEVGSLEDPRAIAAGKAIETHSNLLRKHVKDLGILEGRVRKQRGLMLSDILAEYKQRKGGGEPPSHVKAHAIAATKESLQKQATDETHNALVPVAAFTSTTCVAQAEKHPRGLGEPCQSSRQSRPVGKSGRFLPVPKWMIPRLPST
jgi:hypothetical protein